LKDYTFSDEGFVLIDAGQKDGDTIEIMYAKLKAFDEKFQIF
jgi:hypothetical protein